MWTRRQIAVLLAASVVIISGVTIVIVANSPPGSGLLPFRNYGDLSSFLDGARTAAPGGSMLGGFRSNPAMPVFAGPAAGGTGTPSYSSTNIQVAGVDELDMVKTDGTYLYVASQNEVDIFLAYPATDLHVVTRLALSNLTGNSTLAGSLQATGLFLNGHHLLAVANAAASYYGLRQPMLATPVATGGVVAMPLLVAPEKTYLFLFDVTDAANPVLQHTLTLTGATFTGRMVGPIAYLIATQWIQQVNGSYVLPEMCVDGACRTLAPYQIYHDPQSFDAWDYTNLLAVDVRTGDSQPTSIVTGGYSVLYMSPTSLYLAFFKWSMPAWGSGIATSPTTMGTSWTTVYKLRADGLDVTTVASGDVPGSLLNQYSMDEWHGYLRVATTVRDFSGNQSSVRNDVYVFDGTMNRVGSVVGMAPGESIFAVRFLEDKAYVVTFRKIDPLFVIDLSDPTAPRVSGFLEMPGFSEYLYPLDAAHLIGVGKDAIPAIEGNWSWYQGLKLSLYDVTNATSPTETAKVTIGDRGTQSEVLNDPHAFLYVPERQLVVLPVDLAILNASQYPDGIPSWAWGDIVWQGAYVYRVNESSGFQYVGRVAHGNGTVNRTYGWYSSPTQIRRSLYIGDTLYTISATEVLASSLVDLSTVASVVYATPPTCPYCGPVPLA